MTNLLEETTNIMLGFEKSPDDIIFIGSESSGHSCTWEEFVVLANKDYHAGYGSAEVATDLIIVFNDGSRLDREEYDGAEWWEFRNPFQMPTEIKPIVNLFGGCWDSLEELQKGDDYA